MDRIQEQILVLEAYKKGEEIEYRNYEVEPYIGMERENPWKPFNTDSVTCPGWDFVHFEFRVKQDKNPVFTNFIEVLRNTKVGETITIEVCAGDTCDCKSCAFANLSDCPFPCLKSEREETDNESVYFKIKTSAK